VSNVRSNEANKDQREKATKIVINFSIGGNEKAND
jgi:hypothetical protein